MQTANELNHLIYTGSGVQAIDRYAIEKLSIDGFELMTRAGTAAFTLIRKRFPLCQNLCVLCGGGNNGGDGYVVAKLALEAKWRVILIPGAKPKTESCQRAYTQYLAAGGKTVDEPPADLDSKYIIVDALLGTGLRSAPHSRMAELIVWANRQTCSRVALDAPSGADSDTGHCFDPAISADLTITFIAHKLGLMTGPSSNQVGMLELDSLSIPQTAFGAVNPCAQLLPAPHLKTRHRDSHKGSFGHVLVVGGTKGMAGAGMLCATAALRSGCGKVHWISDHDYAPIMAAQQPEIMTGSLADLHHLMTSASVIAIGPGLGTSLQAKKTLQEILESDVPMVIDADALTLISEEKIRDTSHIKQMVVTPHPGEAARMLGTDTRSIQSNRLEAAEAIARQFNCVCVLKGHGTLISADNALTSLCDIGNNGMATAGCGDVLTGITAGLIAQGYEALEAACTAVWLHAKAGDMAAQSLGMHSLIASDIINHLGAAFKNAAQFTPV